MSILNKLFGGWTKQRKEMHRGPAYASTVLPDFPLNPMRGPSRGEPIKGELLADVAAVALCIHDVLLFWKQGLVGRDWPSYGDRELNALAECIGAMVSNIPPNVKTDVDVSLVRNLFRKYLVEVESDSNIYQEFYNGDITLLFLTIDFCNTIGYGGLIQTTLEWYEG